MGSCPGELFPSVRSPRGSSKLRAEVDHPWTQPFPAKGNSGPGTILLIPKEISHLWTWGIRGADHPQEKCTLTPDPLQKSSCPLFISFGPNSCLLSSCHEDKRCYGSAFPICAFLPTPTDLERSKVCCIQLVTPSQGFQITVSHSPTPCVTSLPQHSSCPSCLSDVTYPMGCLQYTDI